jgi:hypothetical protein
VYLALLPINAVVETDCQLLAERACRGTAKSLQNTLTSGPTMAVIKVKGEDEKDFLFSFP